MYRGEGARIWGFPNCRSGDAIRTTSFLPSYCEITWLYSVGCGDVVLHVVCEVFPGAQLEMEWYNIVLDTQQVLLTKCSLARRSVMAPTTLRVPCYQALRGHLVVPTLVLCPVVQSVSRGCGGNIYSL